MTVKQKLGRNTAHRWAMLRTMVTQLIQYERIQTTLPKAKVLRKLADRVVTYAKKGDRRGQVLVSSVVRTPREQFKLLTQLAERYKDRAGGYTRIVHLGRRQRDAAQMAYIEYVDREGELRPARPPNVSLLPLAAQEVFRQQQQQMSISSPGTRARQKQ